MDSRAAALLIRSWRTLAEQPKLGVGAWAEMSVEQRETGLSVWTHASEMLLRSSGLCHGCIGDGVSFSPATEDEEAAWSVCWFCKGSGLSDRPKCANCGRVEDQIFVEKVGDVDWCSSCAGLEKLRPGLYRPEFEPPFNPVRLEELR